MIHKFSPAGTLLFGRAVINQLGYELELFKAVKPAVLTIDAYRKKALKSAAMINYSSGIAVSAEPAHDSDFLILAGGKTLIDRWKDDPRPKAWIMLKDADLLEYSEPAVDFIIADSLFLRSRKAVQKFMEQYAFSISDGLASHHGDFTVPESFTYSCSTAVLAGNDVLSQLPDILNEAPVKMQRPLILTDKGIVSIGLLDKLVMVLDGIEYRVFDEIPPDSSSRVVNEISSYYRREACDGIIAFGGGSVLDTGKGVFLNVSMETDDIATLAGSNKIPELTVPFIAIPTTSGTGSEVTKVAVVNDQKRKRKILYVSPKLMPALAVLDSSLTVSLPPQLSSITGMDALSHAIEAYTCLGKNPISDQMAWKAITLIRDNLIPVMTDPENVELRMNLALASNMAGQAFSNSMVGMVHSIGHSVGSVCHAPHGSCMSVLLPFALEYNLSEISPLLAELLPAVAGAAAADSVAHDDKAGETIETIRRMNLQLKELTGGRHPVGLSDIKDRDGSSLIQRSHFQQIAEVSLGDASIVYNPVELRISDIHGVLEKSY